MFPSRNFKRSVVAFKNFAKCNGTCSKAIASDHYRISSNYSSHSHSHGSTSSSKWTSPFLYAAGGAMLMAGLKSQLETSKVYAEEVPEDLGSATAIESEVTFMEPIVNAESEKTCEVVEEAAPVVAEKPPKPKVFPEQVQYLLVGGGTASYSAMRAIRKRDVTAKVLIVTDEAAVPYMRPPLSKELWFTDDKDEKQQLRFKQWNGKYKGIHYDKEAFYCPPEELNQREEGGVAVATGKKVVKVNASKNVATLDDGTVISYDKCLLATGGSPKNLPVFEKADDDVKKRVTLFRKIQDFLDLDELTDNLKSVTVVGGGFLGSELSCALAFKGKVSDFSVNQVFREKGNMARVLPEYLTKWTTKKVEREGVNVVPQAEVDKAEMTDDNRVLLTLTNGQQLVTDHVIVAVGLEVDTDLARSSGIEVDEKLGGYRVNTELQARSNIWVAGDASCFYDTKLGRRRVEHHDHAVISGRLAGENMTGAQKSYYHQSMFWSDLGPDVGYEAIGVIDSSLNTVAVFSKASAKDTPVAREEALALGAEAAPVLEQQAVAEPATPLDKEQFQKGVIFYLRDQVVVGVLLWNVFGRMSLARKIIREQQKHQDFGELAKLFQVYKDELDEE